MDHEWIMGGSWMDGWTAPEQLLGKPHDQGVDWWAVGVLFYEMLFGHSPFASGSRHELYRRTIEEEVPFPENLEEILTLTPDEMGSDGMFPPLLQCDLIVDIIRKLLMKNPMERLNIKTILKHPLLKDIDWRLVEDKCWRDPPIGFSGLQPLTAAKDIKEESGSEDVMDEGVDEQGKVEDDELDSAVQAELNAEGSDASVGDDDPLYVVGF
jgi:serine/threonine protein kinase